MKRVGLIEACDDPQLFNVKLWPRQREILEAIERGDKRPTVLALGRRSGKTLMCAIVLLHYCLLRPDLDRFMRPGERRYSVGFATGLRQARLLVAAARSIVEASPLLASTLEGSTEDELRFNNSTAFAAFPNSSRGGRGWAIHALAMDEAAHFNSETDGYQSAERVFAALAPSSAQFGDDCCLLVSSTPWGSEGWFATTHQRAASGELEDAQAFQKTTAEMNPTISTAFLERERQRDPDTWPSEYEARFAGSGGAFLDPSDISAAIAERPEIPPGVLSEVCAGIDPSFSSDPFGIAIVGRDPGDFDRLVVAKAYAVLPRRSQSFEEQRAIQDYTLDEVIRELLRYRCEMVWTDQYCAPAVTDKLTRAGMMVESIPMTSTSKTAAYSELRVRLQQRRLELYPNDDLIGELRRLRTKFTAGSASVITPHAGGSHGDIAHGLAMACYGRGDLYQEPAAAETARYVHPALSASPSEFG